MKKTIVTLALLTLGAASSSAKLNPKPEWIDGSSMEYPREKFLTGVGMADDRASAEDRARGEISKIFSTVVTVNTNSSASESTKTSGSKTENAFAQNVSNSVQTASKKALEGVDVVEHWQDDATRQYYALAILDREKGVKALADKIGEFDKQAAQLNASLEKGPELSKVKAGLKLLTLLKARQDLNNELRVIDPEGKTLPNPLDEAAIRPKASKAIAGLDVKVILHGDSADEIETGIISGLNQFGLQAQAGTLDSPVDIVVEGNVNTTPMNVSEPKWKYARSSLTVSLKDGHSQKTFGRFDAYAREASGEYDEAVRRSRVSLGKKAAAQVNEAITAYFENQ